MKTLSIVSMIFLCLDLALTTFSAGAADSQPAEVAPAGDTPVAQTDPSIQQYLDQIAEQQRLHGAYDPLLGEQLLGLGLLYKNKGQYQEAAIYLDQALHIKKINEGLQSMSQVPILEALIEANTAARNWEELNKNYHLLLWVHQRNLTSGNPELLPVFLRVGQWLLEAYGKGLLKDPPATILSDLISMYNTILNIMQQQYGDKDPRLIVPLKILALTSYQQVTEVANHPLADFQGYGNRYSYQQRCVPVPRPGGRVDVICEMMEIPNPYYYVSKQQTKDISIADQMQKVKSVLNRIADIDTANPGTRLAEKAAALVNLGDWYFINDKQSSAIENYKQAYQLLAVSGPDGELVKRLFDNPVRIPVMTTGLPAADDTPTDKVTPPYVRLSFNVSGDGRASKIEVIDTSEPRNFRIRRTAIEIVNSSIFRPRFVDGKFAPTQANQILLSGGILQSEPLHDPGRDSRSALKIRR